MKLAGKLLRNTLLGGLGIYLYNLLGAGLGLSLGLNIPNIAMIGLLGWPGFALALVVKIMGTV